MGTYVVLRKLAFIGDGIAHASFAGIVIAYLRGANYNLGAAIVAVLTALGIGFVNRRGGDLARTAIGVLFTGAFALGIFLMSRAPRYSVDLQSFLFGNILAVSRERSGDIVGLAIIVAASSSCLCRPLLYSSFDPIVAQASGIRGRHRRLRVARRARAHDHRLAPVGRDRARRRAAGHAGGGRGAAHLALLPMLALAGIVRDRLVGRRAVPLVFLAAASGATIVLLATVIFFASVGIAAARRRVRETQRIAS